MKTTGVNGTCGAFFFYLNDTQEIDMELLSKANQGPSQAGFVHLVIQSDENQKKGYIEMGSPDYDAHSLIFSPKTAYNEFRFDWLPDRVDFYANGELLRTITDNVPSSPGSLHIIHWSNGNDGWSGGPPEEDAVMTVSYVKAYFNSSNPVSTSKSLYNCHPSGRVGDVACRIPDQTVPPNPLGPNGNRTAQTYFFSRDIENLVTGLITPTATKTSHPTSGSERSFGDGSGSILCWMIGLGVGVFAFHGFDAFTALHAWMGIRAP
jgi:beta-glucanase (GH16 family)